MKKFLFLSILLLGVAFTAQSQDFKPFRVDGGLGYGLPFGDTYDGGVLFYLEPKYEIGNKIAFGLRWEGTLFAGASEYGGDVNLSSGYLLTGDYYFNTNKFRPFAGVGLGVHRIAGLSFTVDDISVKGGDKTNFGALVRAGFDISHFRLALSYNYAGKLGNDTHHYLGISVGFYIGGGKK